MRKIIESSVVQWLRKFLASIVLAVVGFILLKFFPRDADEKIITPVFTGTLGSLMFVFVGIGFLIDALRAWTKKKA